MFILKLNTKRLNFKHILKRKVFLRYFFTIIYYSSLITIQIFSDNIVSGGSNQMTVKYQLPKVDSICRKMPNYETCRFANRKFLELLLCSRSLSNIYLALVTMYKIIICVLDVDICKLVYVFD